MIFQYTKYFFAYLQKHKIFLSLEINQVLHKQQTKNNFLDYFWIQVFFAYLQTTNLSKSWNQIAQQ
jgi:hypothetical protein